MSVITISRMYGSGGSEVARLVAEELGWAPSLALETTLDDILDYWRGHTE